METNVSHFAVLNILLLFALQEPYQQAECFAQAEMFQKLDHIQTENYAYHSSGYEVRSILATFKDGHKYDSYVFQWVGYLKKDAPWKLKENIMSGSKEAIRDIFQANEKSPMDPQLKGLLDQYMAGRT